MINFISPLHRDVEDAVPYDIIFGRKNTAVQQPSIKLRPRLRVLQILKGYFNAQKQGGHPPLSARTVFNSGHGHL